MNRQIAWMIQNLHGLKDAKVSFFRRIGGLTFVEKKEVK